MKGWTEAYSDKPDTWPNEGQDVLVRMTPPLAILDNAVHDTFKAKFTAVGSICGSKPMPGFCTNAGMLCMAKFQNGVVKWQSLNAENS